jgi:hypothetical protein
MFASRMGELKSARAFIEDFCKGAGVPKASGLKGTGEAAMPRSGSPFRRAAGRFP